MVNVKFAEVDHRTMVMENIFTPRKYTLKCLRVNRKKLRSKEPGCVQLSLKQYREKILFFGIIICIIFLLLNSLLLSKFFPNKTFKKCVL